MYEDRRERLLSTRAFVMRVLVHGGVVAAGIAIALGVGVLGYRVFVHLPWIDALLNAAMILGGMGPVDRITTSSGKVFASIYALFSGLFVIAAAGVLIAPFLHRMMHRFHLERERNRDDD